MGNPLDEERRDEGIKGIHYALDTGDGFRPRGIEVGEYLDQREEGLAAVGPLNVVCKQGELLLDTKSHSIGDPLAEPV
jgi:hypothetical protein